MTMIAEIIGEEKEKKEKIAEIAITLKAPFEPQGVFEHYPLY